MVDGLELHRYVLNREIDFWLEEGKYRTGDRICNLPADSPEAKNELAWQDHCLKRMNAAAWELVEVEGRGSRHADAHFANIEDWRNRESR